MGAQIEGPIFVSADEPLLIFDSVEQAVAWMEWQDVEDRIYVGHDRNGRRIDFTTDANRTVGFLLEEAPARPDELRSWLLEIMARWSPRRPDPSATLADLETLAVEHFGLTG